MRIRISAPKDNGKRFHLYLPVPLFVARWGFIWKHLPEPSRQYAPVASKVVSALKEYKRQNGSWNLVEVQTADGSTTVEIKV